MKVIPKELSSQDQNRNQRIVTLEGSILKAGDAEFKIQQALTKFEDQMDGLAIKIANLAPQVIAKCDPSTWTVVSRFKGDSDLVIQLTIYVAGDKDVQIIP